MTMANDVNKNTHLTNPKAKITTEIQHGTIGDFLSLFNQPNPTTTDNTTIQTTKSNMRKADRYVYKLHPKHKPVKQLTLWRIHALDEEHEAISKQ